MDTYTSLDKNPERHPFFELLNYDNNRLKHLGLLARFLLIELDEGPTKVTGYEVTKLFDCERGGFSTDEPQPSFEDRSPVKRVDEMLDLLHDIYSDSQMKTSEGNVVFFDTEYFMISLYTLLRELNFGNYRIQFIPLPRDKRLHTRMVQPVRKRARRRRRDSTVQGEQPAERRCRLSTPLDPNERVLELGPRHNGGR